MLEHASRTRLDDCRSAAVLPADGVTLASSLSRGLMLVAHTGRAHVGVQVDGALLREVEREQAVAATSEPLAMHDAVSHLDLPEVITFRHATSHTFAVSGGDLYLYLHATGDPGKLDVHVELRMDRPLLRRLAQHKKERRRKRRTLALSWLLTVSGALAATLAIATRA